MTTVIIPAHNEETVVGRCLDAILDDATTPDDIDIIVSCNGCTDETATVARSRGVRVIETPVPSKVEAIRAAERVSRADAFPRVYLDADVQLAPGSLQALTDALDQPGLQAAAPRIHVDTTQASLGVRAYQAVWSELPDIKGGLAGRGAYALSAEGRGRFGEFVDVVADDLFVHRLFWPDDGSVVDDAVSTVHSSRRLRDLIARKRRVFRGNAEIDDRDGRDRDDGGEGGDGGDGGGQSSRVRDLIGIVRSKPHLLPALPVYLAVGVLCRYLADRDRSRGDHTWRADASSRR